ncbi:MAG: FecR domain-containing protein [Treponema sp.]|jgi:hypothetical protein|nr:FecR domain-containing protein [Treponema sp.]
MKKALIVLFMVWAGVSAFAQNGVIRNLAGTVELKPAGAAAFSPAKAGDEVAADTVIFTGFKSSATVVVGSSTILVRALTRLTLTEIREAQGTEHVGIDLKAGRVRVDVKPPSGGRADFTVVTPIATASVRGTNFELDTRNLRVHEGAVAYRGLRGGAVTVYSGPEIHVDLTSGKVSDPVVAAAAELLPPVPAGAQGAASSTPAAGAATGAPAAPTTGAPDGGFQFD